MVLRAKTPKQSLLAKISLPNILNTLAIGINGPLELPRLLIPQRPFCATPEVLQRMICKHSLIDDEADDFL